MDLLSQVANQIVHHVIQLLVMFVPQVMLSILPTIIYVHNAQQDVQSVHPLHLAQLAYQDIIL